MDGDFPEERAAFIFSDPGGRRWPRLRLSLLFGGIVAFIENAYRQVRPAHAGSEDERIYVAAAEGLQQILPAEGLDPFAFAERLLMASGSAQPLKPAIFACP